MKDIIKIEEIAQRDMIPGFKARMLHTNSMTISYWEVEKGSKLPEHHHLHEQVSQILEGEFEFTVGETTQVVTPGKVVIIPSNVPHSGVALSDCMILDIFSPVREDYKIE